MRNISLWSDVVFEKEVVFHEFDFETTDLEFEVSKSSIWKHTTSCDKGVFSFIVISQLWQPIELKCSQVFYFMHMYKYIKSKDWSLTITNSVQCCKNCKHHRVWHTCLVNSTTWFLVVFKMRQFRVTICSVFSLVPCTNIKIQRGAKLWKPWTGTQFHNIGALDHSLE